MSGEKIHGVKGDGNHLSPPAANCSALEARTKIKKAAIIEDMTTVRITEAELARDVRAVIETVQQGREVIIEGEDHRPVAVITSPNRSGRPIADILREAKQRNSTVTLDRDFGNDLEKIIASHEQPWNPPSWD